MDREFVDFVRGSQSRLMRFGMLLSGGNPHIAEDLVQETLLLVGRRWKRMGRVDHPEAYARRTMARLWWNRSRRERREVLRAELDEPLVQDATPAWESPIWVALQQLPPRQRAVLVLRYFEDYSEAQIAEALSCRPGTVKSQASRGIATLRTLLGERHHVPFLGPVAQQHQTSEGDV